MKSDSGIDRVLFGTTVALIAAASVPMALSPDAAGELVAGVYSWIAERFGLLYQWATLAAIVILVWIAVGRHGAKRLGGQDVQPEFSTWSWAAMLFSAGIGAGLLYWSSIEWAFYMDTPPFGIEPGTASAREWAAAYGIFHWGFSAWCLYCLPTVAIAYPYYAGGADQLRLSTGLTGWFGSDFVGTPIGRLVDFVFIVALVGGTGTSLGLATPMIAACLSTLFNATESLALDLSVVVIAVTLFAASVYLGLERGIKRLSELNMLLAGVFVVFVLVAGPTLFQLKMGTNALGLIVQHFVRLSTWTDPILGTGFVEDWSVFYWAWWLAYGPFMGLFVTRISRGRTLRQLIGGMIGYGTLGCAVFYVTVGNTAMWMDMEGLVAVQSMVSEGRADTAIASVIASLPLYPLPLIAFVVMAFVFVATTYDSASYAIAASATRHLPAGAHPARYHRVFWAFALAVLPMTLLLVGGLRAMQSAVLVVSLPVLVITVVMTISLFKSLRAEDESHV